MPEWFDPAAAADHFVYAVGALQNAVVYLPPPARHGSGRRAP